MKTRIAGPRVRTRAARMAVALLTAGMLSGCGELLEVELPAQLTGEVLEDPVGATTLLNTIVGNFEEAHNNFVWEAFGREASGEIRLASAGTTHSSFHYDPEATIWFNQIARSRKFAAHLHDKLTNDWTAAQVPNRARYLAVSSIYAGAVYRWMGSALCEASIAAGPLVMPDELLDSADTWLTRAVTEIDAAGGDFAMPFGVSTSAKTMAYGLRAQARWMAGDAAGALEDARRVPRGFVAVVAREATPARRNLSYYNGTFLRYHEVYDVIDWWEGQNNPATGQPWPAVIPFTGYTNLGILPDGRAVREDGLPIRTAGPHRTPAETAAVPDVRVKTLMRQVQGKGAEGWVNAKYTGEGDDLPLVNWKEMWLIRAELEGGQAAINLVNELRVADGLPQVTYADPSNAQQIRYMVIEERRRVLFLEGRFFFTMLKNPDVLWFPRASGEAPGFGAVFGGGVKFVMPQAEFDLNPNLSLEDRATGCPGSIAPVIRG